MFEDEQPFDEADDARRGLQVADICLHRPDRQRTVRLAAAAERLRKRGRFNRITHRRAGAVGLDEADLPRIDARIRAGIPHQLRLRFRAGQRNTVGVAVLIQRGSDDHGVDRVAVRQRVRQRLEQDHARPLAADKTVGAGVERLAVAVGREHAGLRKPDEPVRRDHHRDTARHRHPAAPGVKLLARQVDRRQRGRARRVHREARPAQVQAVRNAVRADAVRASGGRMRADRGAVGRATLDVLVVVVREADEHADVRAALEIEHHTRVLDRLPRRLQQQPLLRVDVRRLARRNPEKLRVELVHPLDEPAAPGDALARQAGLRVIKALHIPAVGRHLRYHIPPIHKQFPERLGVVRSSRKSATDPDYGNGVSSHRFNFPLGGIRNLRHFKARQAIVHTHCAFARHSLPSAPIRGSSPRLRSVARFVGGTVTGFLTMVGADARGYPARTWPPVPARAIHGQVSGMAHRESV